MSCTAHGAALNAAVALGFGVGLLGVAGTSSGAAVLTSRLSSLNYSATYGGGGDVFTPSDSRTDPALLASDAESMQFADFQQGALPGDPIRPWSAGVSTLFSHEYAVTGPMSGFSRIVSSGSTHVQAGASGAGLATIGVQNPGNSLEFAFSLGESAPATLAGEVSLTPDGQNLAAAVELRRFDGFTWAIVFTTLFFPGQEGAFNQAMMLDAGDYRLTAWAGGNAFAGVRPEQTNTWSYDLQIIPAPGALAALVVGLIPAARRRRA